MSRILLKLSGESFADPVSNFGIQPGTIESIASEITEANNKGIEIGVVEVEETSSEVYKNLPKIWHKLMLIIWGC